MHWHEYFEMIVPIEGTGQFRVGSEVARFQPGDLLVVDNLKLHGVAQLSGSHRSLVIFFPTEAVAPMGSAGADHAFLAPLCGRPEDVPPLMRATAECAGDVHAALLQLARAFFADASVSDRFVSAKVQLLTILARLRSHFGLRQDYAEDLSRRRQRALRLEKVFTHLAAHLSEQVSQPEVAAVAGMSTSRFREFFKQTTGRTFVDYLRDLRLSFAAQLLRESDSSVAEVAMEAGFTDQSYLHRCFKVRFGCAPLEYRKHFQHELHHATSST